jgi:hypothetical protein
MQIFSEKCDSKWFGYSKFLSVSSGRILCALNASFWSSKHLFTWLFIAPSSRYLKNGYNVEKHTYQHHVLDCAPSEHQCCSTYFLKRSYIKKSLSDFLPANHENILKILLSRIELAANFCWFLSWLTVHSWTQMLYVPPKHPSFSKLRGIII